MKNGANQKNVAKTLPPPLPQVCVPVPAEMAGQEDHSPFPSRPAPSAGSHQPSESNEPNNLPSAPAAMTEQGLPPPAPSSLAPSVDTQNNTSKSYELRNSVENNEETEEAIGLVGYYRDKIKNSKLFKQFMEIYQQFTSEERLKECMHPYDTQLNEAMNTSVSRYARKERIYCSTMSLTNRVMIDLGTLNCGYYGYWSCVFDKLNMPISESLEAYLKYKDGKKEEKRL